MLFLLLLFSCGTPKKSIEPGENQKTTQKADIQHPAKPAAIGKDEEGRKKCMTQCLRSKQMEARAIEAIKADCERQCENPKPKPSLPVK